MRVAKHWASLALAAIVLGSTSAPTPAAAQENYLGELRLFGMNWCPRMWTPAEGQLIPINQNQSLYSLFGTFYGGDGRTTFALPDLRGRSSIGFGQGTGLSNYPIGQKGGSETITMTVDNLPSHTHGATTTATLNATADTGNTDTPGNTVVLANARGTDIYGTGANGAVFRNDAITANTTLDTSGGQPKSQRGPYLAMKWCVALQGIFPPRN